MRDASRRLGVAAFAALSILVVSAALAWACSPQASIGVTPDGGLARSGATATVSGSAFLPSTVRIMWGSASGTQIGTAQGPNFSVPVSIPETAAGVNYIVAVVEGDGGKRFTASTAYEVTSSQGAQAATPPPAGQGSGSSPKGTRSSPKGTPAPAATGSKPPRANSRVGSGRARVPSSNPGAVTTRSGRAVFGGSSPAATPDRAARPGHQGASDGSKRGDGAPSQQTLSLGDISRGFSSPSKALSRPSLTSPLSSADPAGTQLTAGMILLGTGLMALFGSFLVAGARRRRSLAAGDRQQH